MEDHEAFFDTNSVPSLDDILATAPPPVFSPAMGDMEFSGDFRSVWNLHGEAGPSSFPAENSHGLVGDQTSNQAWHTLALDCNFGQVLRTITHVHYGYNHYMKLEIYGGLGVISHAIVEKKVPRDHNAVLETQFETLDFSSKSTWDVKQILEQYCWERNEEGFINISNDPLTLFYEALCVDNQNNFNNIIIPGSEPQQHQQPTDRPENRKMIRMPIRNTINNNNNNNNNNNGIVRVPLSEQRKRTATLTLLDLREFFHLGLADAAKSLDVCSTVLKKICRRDGIPRWPYRKVDSVKKKIEALQPNLYSRHPAVRAEAREKIERLRQEASDACGGFIVL